MGGLLIINILLLFEIYYSLQRVPPRSPVSRLAALALVEPQGDPVSHTVPVPPVTT
jgi:hypothetical protein